MLEHWQTLAAAGVVALTITFFLVGLARPKKKSSCAKGCGCGKSSPKPPRHPSV
ncbi:MAG: hypothetical protein ORN51_07490 [Akkermansiaceae bacterium]|nr:hypothetical protein [Akkermansiaceae bacterium]